MRRLRTIVLMVLAIVAVAFGVLYVAGAIPYEVKIVHTGSMSPTFQPGSAVFIRTGQYKVGQPIACNVHGDVVTHRLIGEGANGALVTKGDANTTADPWQSTPSAVIGGVVASTPYLGFVLYYLLFTPTGALSILLLFVCLWQVKWLVYELIPDEGLPAAQMAAS